IVISGLGWAQREGGPVEEIRPGDVVWFPPNEKHWHGAMPTTAMTHIAIQEALDGRVVDWMEQVSEAQYGGKEYKLKNVNLPFEHAWHLRMFLMRCRRLSSLQRQSSENFI